MNQLSEQPAHPDTYNNLAAQRLITLNPVEYVGAVFRPFEYQLDKAIEESRGVTYDVKTTAGMATAVEWRRRFREIRIGADKERKTRKAPILEIGKLLDSTFKELEAEVEQYEKGHDLAIKFEEAEKERIRAEKIAAEEKRIADLHKKVGYIINLANEAVGKPSATIAQVIEFTSAIKVDAEVFEELAANAALAKAETLERLERLREAADKQEKEAERLRLEREELAKQRKEQALAHQWLALAEQRLALVEAAAALKAQQEAHLRPVLPETPSAPVENPEPATTPQEVKGNEPEVQVTVYARPSNEELTVVISEFFGVPYEVARGWLFGSSNG